MTRCYKSILPNGKISSRFNPQRVHPNTGVVRPHNGIDLAAPAGSPIFAPHGGVVVAVGTNLSSQAGYWLAIKHTLSDGRIVVTRYLHMQEPPSFNINDTVSGGQQVGKVGNTGIGTGPHLHYEERAVPSNKPNLPWNLASPIDPDHDLFDLGCNDSPIKQIKDKTGSAASIPSPIVLDLDGDGVETVDVANGTYFDHAADGFAELSGWADSDDGLLVRDVNGNGVAETGGELFGSETLLANGQKAANGFEALHELDSNNDGVIDENDPSFGELRVWKDAELLTLREVGVDSINVAYANSTYVDSQGNSHRQVGSYTTTTGAIRVAADVWFRTDPTYSLPTNWVEVPEDTAALPDAQGYGKVRDLQQAMAMDATGELKALVEAFTQATTPQESDQLVTRLIYHWTGVQDIDPYSRASRSSSAPSSCAKGRRFRKTRCSCAWTP